MQRTAADMHPALCCSQLAHSLIDNRRERGRMRNQQSEPPQLIQLFLDDRCQSVRPTSNVSIDVNIHMLLRALEGGVIMLEEIAFKISDTGPWSLMFACSCRQSERYSSNHEL